MPTVELVFLLAVEKEVLLEEWLTFARPCWPEKAVFCWRPLPLGSALVCCAIIGIDD